MQFRKSPWFLLLACTLGTSLFESRVIFDAINPLSLCNYNVGGLQGKTNDVNIYIGDIKNKTLVLLRSLVYVPANCCLLLSWHVKLITKGKQNIKQSSVTAIVWPNRFSHFRIIRLIYGFLFRKTINVWPIIHAVNVSSFEGRTEHIYKFQSPTISV